MQYPHLNGANEYPHLNTEDVWIYRNAFDYRRWGAQSVITLCTVPYSADFRDVVEWGTAQRRDALFDEIKDAYKTVLNTNFRLDPAPEGGDVVKIPIPFDVANRFNYLFVDLAVATNEGGKIPYETDTGLRRWYFFVTECRQSAPNTTVLTLKLDTWTTYRPYVDIQGYVLERGHAPVAEAATPAEFLDSPIDNTENLLTADVAVDDSGRFVTAKPLNFAGDKIACFVAPYTQDALQHQVPAPATPGGSTPPAYFDIDERNGWQKGVRGYDWHAGARDYSRIQSPAPAVLPTGSPDTRSLFVYAVPAAEAVRFFDTWRTENLNTFRDITAVFTINRAYVDTLATFPLYGSTVSQVAASPTAGAVASLKFTVADFNFPERYKRFTKLYTSPYCKATVTDNLGNVHEIPIQELSGASGLKVRTVMAAPAFKTIATLENVGGTGSAQYSWERVDGSTATGQISHAQFDAILWENNIPLYQVSASAAQMWDVDQAYSQQQARANAVVGYMNTVAGGNTGYQNAVDSANTGYQNAVDSANTGYRNAVDSANTGYQNAVDSTNTGYQNAVDSANTGYRNAVAAANTGYRNAVDSANTGYQNAVDSATTGYANASGSAYTSQIVGNTSALTAKNNAERSNNTAKSNADASADAAYANVARNNQASNDNTALAVALSAANQATCNATKTRTIHQQNKATTRMAERANEMQNELLAIEQTSMGQTAIANGIASLASILTNPTPSGIAGGIGGAVMGGVSTAVQANARADETEVHNRFRVEDTFISNDYSISLSLQQNTFATDINERTNATTAAQNTNNVNAASDNATRSRDTAKANALATKNTSNSNATDTYNQAVANNLANYNQAIANAGRSRDTSNANAGRSRDTSNANAGRSRDTSNTNAGRSRDTSNANADYSRDTTVENAKRTLENTQAGYIRAAQQAGLGPVAAITSAGGDQTRDALGLNGYTARLNTPKADNIKQIGDQFARYGYASEEWWEGNQLQKMKRFTYVKARDIMARTGLATTQAVTAVKEILETGVTVWASYGDVNAISIYDNWR